MNPDLAQFREKLVRLRDHTSLAIAYIDSDGPLYDATQDPDRLVPLVPHGAGFSIGDFTVLDRFSTFTKEPN